MSDEDLEALDEEFLYHLNRGADCLTKGESEPARAALQRALELRPKDAKALGLLGQSLYKLGRFDEAVEVYGRLVDETPVEAAARVNLGLAALKARRYPQAVRQLEITLDLNPGHKKAMGYLGLAWLEQGDPARAKEWFARAESDQMVAKCDELLEHAHPPARAEETTAPVEPAPTVRSQAAASAPAPPAASVPSLATFGAGRLVGLESRAPFVVNRGLLSVAVDREALSRADGLIAVRGAVRIAHEMKHFRGRPTEKTFGEGSRRMLRVSGAGTLLYRASGAHFSPIELEGQSAYFREEAVFAFEGAVAFENGRLASNVGADLHLVHLRGPGRALLVTLGEVAAVDVDKESPLRVPAAVLVGWTGTMTPKMVPLIEQTSAGSEAPPREPIVVELTGEGRALLDEGAA